jgi:hypothetical protein
MMTALVLAAAACLSIAAAPAAGDVAVLRVPDDGIQPQARVDDRGVVHMIYFKGDAGHGDVYYVRSDNGGGGFSEPLRVNNSAGSAIAAGTVRGPHMAIGKGGRVHVAWMGSDRAEPKAPGGKTPMLYTRMNDAGDGFEPERNVVSRYVGLDGGGSVAADGDGNVYVAWHAPRTEHTEADRHVWVTRSQDGGETFVPETAVNTNPTGCCACCGMRIFAAGDGKVYVLYRTATDTVHRDTHLLVSADHGKTFNARKLSPWTVAACVMSTASFNEGNGGVVAAWETEQQVQAGRIDFATDEAAALVAMPGEGENRKHPAVAVNGRGEFIVAWTEGTSWNKGGSVAWQVFDREGKPLPRLAGRADGLPAWGLPAVMVRPDDTFAVIY